MKTILVLFMLTGSVLAQTPNVIVPKESEVMEEVVVPEDNSRPPAANSSMPVVRSGTSFYRLKTDPKNIVRATTDNMPVKMLDSSTYYTMMHSPRSQYRYKVKPFKGPIVPKPHLHPPQKRN